MELLIFLVEKEGQVASRQEIVDRLWGKDVFVDTEAGINTAIRKIRQTLGDDPESPKFLETVTGKGYRFVGASREAVERGPSSAGRNGNGSGSVAARDPQYFPAGQDPAIGSIDMPSRRFGGKWLTAFCAIAATLALASFVLRGSIRRLWRLHEFQNLRTVRLTSLPGTIASPTFSPDGSQVAFAWKGDANGAGFDLFVKVVDSSDAPHRLTNHPALRLAPAWSPDGRNIAFSRVADDNSGVFMISPSGGVERKIADRTDRSWYGSEVSWSPDGKQLTFIDRPSAPTSNATLQLYLLELDGLTKHEVDTGCPSVGTPAFSPNGRFLAWVCNRKEFRSEIVLQDLRNQQLRTLRQTPTLIEGIAWSLDSQRIVFSTDSDSGALREIEVEDPSHEENIFLGQDAGDLAMHPRASGFAYVKNSYNVNLWRLDLSSIPAHAQQWIASSQTSRAPSISPDGKKIAFESDRTGALQIWIADADGSNAQQITFFRDSTSGTPRWSPDSRKIAFDSRIGFEDAEIYVVDGAGGPPQKLPIDLRGNAQPSFSHDGKWIYFSNGDDQGASAIWKVPAAGGHATRISSVGGTYPLESSDGNLVYFGREERIWSVHPDGTREQVVKGIPSTIFLGDEWFPTPNGIYFMSHPNQGTQIEFYDYQTQSERRVYLTDRPTPPWIGGMPVSSDGKWMLYPQVDRSSSDLMMMEGWK